MINGGQEGCKENVTVMHFFLKIYLIITTAGVYNMIITEVRNSPVGSTLHEINQQRT